MKFKVYMKDPDSLYDGIEESLEKPENLNEEEWELIKEKRIEDAQEIASKWFQWGEYVLIEVDTVEKTARIVPVSEYDK